MSEEIQNNLADALSTEELHAFRKALTQPALPVQDNASFEALANPNTLPDLPGR